MIYPSYIHENSLLDEFIFSLESAREKVDEMFNLYMVEYEYAKIKNACPEDIDFDTYVTEAEKSGKHKKGVFESIGEWVMSIIQKFINFFSELFRRLEEIVWSRTSDIKKAEKIMDKYPNIRDEIKVAISKGDINIKDIKSMQDLMDGTYDIVKKINAGKLNETQAESAFNAVISKWDKYGKPIISIAGGVATIFGLYKTIKTIGPTITKFKIEGPKLKNQAALIKLNADLDKTNPTLARKTGEFISKVCGMITKNLSNHGGIFKKLMNAVQAFDKKFGFDEDAVRKKYDKELEKNKFIKDIMFKSKSKKSDDDVEAD